MLYKPTYCCNCGEKIERIDWKLWTSRRFCENCELSFQKEEWIPKIGVGLALIGGLLGFGSYLKQPEKPINIAKNEVLSISTNKVQNVRNEVSAANSNVQNRIANQPVSANVARQNELKTASLKQPMPKEVSLENQQNEPSEPVYFCGAATKKGTPCTRKVKGGGRCWQHTGLPAVLAKEKLVVSQ